ncbi:MAG: hypothetical protein JRI22_17185 [Deltaproteobacteria bacterium]|nr:hypothetical protein [Deltaproteobacteria bacterium]
MKKLSPVKAIRAFCLQCVNGQRKEVKLCPSEKLCPLWPYRLGTNPTIKRAYSEEHKRKLRENIKIARNVNRGYKEIAPETPFAGQGI